MRDIHLMKNSAYRLFNQRGGGDGLAIRYPFVLTGAAAGDTSALTFIVKERFRSFVKGGLLNKETLCDVRSRHDYEEASRQSRAPAAAWGQPWPAT
jgi:hypothetical protein